MEAATMVADEEEIRESSAGSSEPQTDVADKPDALKTVGDLFRYSAWIHLGPEAEACDHAEDGKCSDYHHFHAWVRLPNQFQHEDIRQKALAAKVRRMRLLRDPASDSYTILEDELDALRNAGKEALVDELLSNDFWKDQTQAINEVSSREEFETIAADQDRYDELREMDEEKRNTEEMEELERHIDRYNAAVDEERAKIGEPRRSALEGRDESELIDLIRDHRISVEGNREFMRTWNLWSWYVGTYNKPRGARVFESKDELEEAPPEILQYVATAFADLEQALQRGLTGNS